MILVAAELAETVEVVVEGVVEVTVVSRVEGIVVVVGSMFSLLRLFKGSNDNDNCGFDWAKLRLGFLGLPTVNMKVAAALLREASSS